MRRIDRRHYRVLQRLDDNLQLKIEVGDHLSTSASESRSLPAMTLPIIDSQATTTSWCVLPPRATRAAVARLCPPEISEERRVGKEGVSPCRSGGSAEP